MSDIDEWIDARTAASILRISERHVNRRGTDGSITMRRVGPRRVLYLRSDVERIAAETQASERPRQQLIPRAEMLPMKDAIGTLEQARHERDAARDEASYLRGQLATQTQQLEAQSKMLVDAQELRIQLAQAQERLETAQARQEAAEAKLALAESRTEHQISWWQRLFGRS